MGPDGVWVTTAASKPVDASRPDDRDRRPLRLQGPLLVLRRDCHARRGRSRPARSGRQARRACSDGRRRGCLDRRPSGQALLRLFGFDDRLCARGGTPAGRRRRRPRPDRPAGRKRGPRAAGLCETAAGVAFVNGNRRHQLLDPAPELLQLPQRRRRLDGRPRNVRLPEARLAPRRTRRRPRGRRLQLDAGCRLRRRVLLARWHHHEAHLGARGHGGLLRSGRRSFPRRVWTASSSPTYSHRRSWRSRGAIRACGGTSRAR